MLNSSTFQGYLSPTGPPHFQPHEREKLCVCVCLDETRWPDALVSLNDALPSAFHFIHNHPLAEATHASPPSLSSHPPSLFFPFHHHHHYYHHASSSFTRLITHPRPNRHPSTHHPPQARHETLRRRCSPPHPSRYHQARTQAYGEDGGRGCVDEGCDEDEDTSESGEAG